MSTKEPFSTKDKQFFGYEEKFEIFARLIESGKLSHAYLFYGYPQIGKFYFARRLAFYLEYGNFAERTAPLIDATFFEPGEEEIISIEAVRNLRKFLSEKPLVSSRRLVIIRDAEFLTKEAESALLKVVEEPPPSATIIFITYDPRVLFAPLRSRLISVYFQPFSKKKIEEILKEKFSVESDRARQIAAKSFGRLGRAINFIKKDKTFLGDEIIEELREEIIDIYTKGVAKNSRVLNWLLEREASLIRFNLNRNLQRKAVQYFINQ